jgi:hypothetical protein
MAGLASVGPLSCDALCDAWTRAAQRADTPRMRGAHCTGIRTQLYLECYCACRRHQACHCRDTETSVRLRFLAALGQAGACSYPITWGARRKAQWLVEN